MNIKELFELERLYIASFIDNYEHNKSIDRIEAAVTARINELENALSAAINFINNGIDLGYIDMPHPETRDPAQASLTYLIATRGASKQEEK